MLASIGSAEPYQYKVMVRRKSRQLQMAGSLGEILDQDV